MKGFLDFLDGYRTFIGLFISVAFKLLAARGYISSESATPANVNDATTLLYTLFSLAGDAYAFYGRMKATKPGALADPVKAIEAAKVTLEDPVIATAAAKQIMKG